MLNFKSNRSARALRLGALALGAGLALSLSACAPSATGDDAATEKPSDGGLTKMTIGLLPVSDLAPLYLGIEQGFFEEAGLELDIQLAQGGAAVVPAVVSGEYAVGYSNTASLLIAGERDMPIKVISNASSSTNTQGSDSVDVAVGPDSDIKSITDLEGKKVAVNALNNFAEIAIKNSIEKAGGDPSKVEFIEVPYPNGPAQLAAGEVDAAWTTEPFRTQIINEGGKIIHSPLLDLGEGVDVAYFFTSSQTLANDKDTIDSFTEAMGKSLDYAVEHEDEVRDVLVSELGLEADVAKAVVMPQFRSEVNRDGLQAMGDAAVKFGIMKKVPNLDELIYTGN